MRGKILAGTLLLMLPSPLRAQLAGEAFIGTAFSAPSNLTIRQAGEPDLDFTAHWATRPTAPSIYYAVRLSCWWGRWAGTIGYIHHKVYLTNNPPEVQDFRVTFGYNLVGVGAGYRAGNWNLMGSVGPVVSNPASEVRGLKFAHQGGIFGTGNHVDGINVTLGVNRRLRVLGWAFFSAEARVSAAWSHTTVANGNADVPNYALHVLLGVGLGKQR
jgi:hypothetical protein